MTKTDKTPDTFRLATLIKDYYSELHKVATPKYTMDPDIRKIYSTNTDLYYNRCDDDADIKAFFFRHEIYLPIIKLKARMDRNFDQYIDCSILPNEFRLSHSEAATLLGDTFVRCRNLILASIPCASADYEHLRDGILNADVNALAAVSIDMTTYYKRLELANQVYHELDVDICPPYPDIVITALYRPAADSIQAIETDDFYYMKETAMAIVVGMWANVDRFSSGEMELVEKTIKSDIFGPFREDCAVHYQKLYGSRPPRPGKTIKPAARTTDDNSADVISGIKAFSEYLGIGTEKAQKVVSSKILQKAGVSYRIGKTNFFNKKKLDDYLAANPQALSNI